MMCLCHEILANNLSVIRSHSLANGQQACVRLISPQLERDCYYSLLFWRRRASAAGIGDFMTLPIVLLPWSPPGLYYTSETDFFFAGLYISYS